MSEKKNHFKNIFIMTLCFLFIMWFISYLWREKKQNILQRVMIFKDVNKLGEFKEEIKKFQNKDENEIKNFIKDRSLDYLDFFELYTQEKNKNIQIKKINQEAFKQNIGDDFKNIAITYNSISGPSTSSFVSTVKQIKIFDNEISFDDQFDFCYLTFDGQCEDAKHQKDPEELKIKKIRDFFTVLTGTNKKYLLETNEVDHYSKYSKYFHENGNSYLKFISSNPLKFEQSDNNVLQKISLKDKDDIVIDDGLASIKKYNNYIHDIVDSKDLINNNFIVEMKIKDLTSPFIIKLFINEDGYLPIQWHNKINWSGKLGFYYIWNVLIIVIGYFLFLFSSTFLNLGFGIVLTTILIRTVSWPIYTKTSTFTLNMSLAQPEIDKIKNKYILKKDIVSAQKMQLEILKVYKKYNIGFLGMLTTFLQIPIFISMLTTLNRFRVPGGMFNLEKKIFDDKPFLSFIDLSYNNSPSLSWDLILIKIFLSFLVGLTMLILNRISFQKPLYLQNKPVNVLNQEEKIKKAQTEKSFKIVSYIMIVIMVCAAWRDNVLSLYWIIGNTYTVFQTIFNRKQMQKKYFLLTKE